MNLFDVILLYFDVSDSQRQLVTVKRWKQTKKTEATIIIKKTNLKLNHSIPGLSMAILKSFSDGRRNFWNRRVGSGVKDLNLIETAIPKPAGLLGDEKSNHSLTEL